MRVKSAAFCIFVPRVSFPFNNFHTSRVIKIVRHVVILFNIVDVFDIVRRRLYS